VYGTLSGITTDTGGSLCSTSPQLRSAVLLQTASLPAPFAAGMRSPRVLFTRPGFSQACREQSLHACSDTYSSDRFIQKLPLKKYSMHKHWCYYRTADGSADYKFSFEEQGDGTWRAYIESQPSYRSRATDAHSTHRLSVGSRKYVCWTSELRSLDEAKRVAALWANKTQEYIRTGKTF
jgi:hypothetical protein